MSNDTMPCGCEGHADNASLCRYPELEAALAAEVKRREEVEAKWSDDERELQATCAGWRARAEQAERERDSLGRDLEAANEENQRLRVERDTHAERRWLTLKDAEEAEGEVTQWRIRAERAEADNAEFRRKALAIAEWVPGCPRTTVDTLEEVRSGIARLAYEFHPGAALLERLRALEEAATKASAELRHTYRPETRDWNLVARAIKLLERVTTPNVDVLKVPRE